MTQAATQLKITEQQPTGWRDIGSPGWQYAWMTQLTDSGIWATLTGGQQGVLWVILSRAGTDGICWPQVPHLMKLSGQSKRSVQGAIKRFKQLGLIVEHAPDQNHANRYFEFMTWSAWVTPSENTPGMTPEFHEEPTPKIAPNQPLAAHARAPQAHTGASPAHAGAPLAHVRAPQAHTGAPLIYRNLNRRDDEESSSSIKSDHAPGNTPVNIPAKSPAATPMSPAPTPGIANAPLDMLGLLHDETPGLFDDEAAASMLVDRQFPIGQARSLVATYGNPRVLEAIVNCDFRNAKGEIHTNYQAFLVGFLKNGYTLDKRIKTQAEATKRREQAIKAKAAIAATEATGRPVTGDAREVVIAGVKLLKTQRDATTAQQREHAWTVLEAQGWTSDRWENALKELEATA